MTRHLRMFPLLLALFSLTLSWSTQAETATFGDYTVHYVVVNSTFLRPEIASQYGITRSDRNAFLNVSVQKNLPEGGTEAVTAEISGQVKNLMQQNAVIDFLEVKEGPALYYLGQFEFSNAELVHFELSIQPEGRGPAHTLSWNTRVYTNR